METQFTPQGTRPRRRKGGMVARLHLKPGTWFVRMGPLGGFVVPIRWEGWAFILLALIVPIVGMNYAGHTNNKALLTFFAILLIPDVIVWNLVIFLRSERL
jgi:hypothetical protein